jgi:hypothetical protein
MRPSKYLFLWMGPASKNFLLPQLNPERTKLECYFHLVIKFSGKVRAYLIAHLHYVDIRVKLLGFK